VSLHIDHVITSGIFSLDGEDFDVDNNIWLVGDDREVIIIDAAHDHRPIIESVGGRNVKAVICTHAHNDHINAAGELAEAVDAPIWLHPDDTMLWEVVYNDRRVDAPLKDGQLIMLGSDELEILHTPGHSPGGVCVYAPSIGTVFSGDTLFNGGPGATGRSFSDRQILIDSIERQMGNLDPAVIVHTGHGDSTSIGAELPNVAKWRSE
jgi:glyoxylase-like metal-dependent hydrolase (beta-lactamase superfamily II)